MRESCGRPHRSAEHGFGDDDVLAELELAGDLPGDGFVIARDHLDVDAHRAGRRDRRGAIVARRIEQRQQPEEPPFAGFVGARHAERAISLGRVAIDRLAPIAFALLGARLAQIDDDLRRALGDLEALAVVLDLRLGALGDRIEGVERLHRHRRRASGGGRAGEDRRVDRVRRIAPRRQRRGQHELVARRRFGAGSSSPSVSSFLVSVPVLSLHSMSMPAISSIATRRETIALKRASRSAPTAMVTESTAGSATGIDATVRMSANCNGFEQRVVAEQRRDPDDENEADRDQDQEIADPQHGALEMRDLLACSTRRGGLAEIGVHAGRGDDAGHLALLGDRAGIGVVADLLVDRQRFAGQRRLIDAEIGAVDQLQIGGDDVAELDQHDVARNQQPRVDVLPRRRRA